VFDTAYFCHGTDDDDLVRDQFSGLAAHRDNPTFLHQMALERQKESIEAPSPAVYCAHPFLHALLELLVSFQKLKRGIPRA
jgi:hypothetical protein